MQSEWMDVDAHFTLTLLGTDDYYPCLWFSLSPIVPIAPDQHVVRRSLWRCTNRPILTQRALDSTWQAQCKRKWQFKQKEAKEDCGQPEPVHSILNCASLFMITEEWFTVESNQVSLVLAKRGVLLIERLFLFSLSLDKVSVESKLIENVILSNWSHLSVGGCNVTIINLPTCNLLILRIQCYIYRITTQARIIVLVGQPILAEDTTSVHLEDNPRRQGSRPSILTWLATIIIIRWWTQNNLATFHALLYPSKWACLLSFPATWLS